MVSDTDYNNRLLDDRVEPVDGRKVSDIREDERVVLFLLYPEFIVVRSLFLGGFCALAFVVGCGYYTFPMWLSLIMTNYVDLSRSEISFLGGMGYVSLGILSFVILMFTRLNLKPGTNFICLSMFAAISAVVTYSTLVSIVWLPNSQLQHHGSGLIFFALACLGFAVGPFYMVWTGVALALLKSKWHDPFISFSGVLFTLGAVVGLLLKLYVITSDKDWMMWMVMSQFGVLALLLPFTFYNLDKILIPPAPQSAAGETHETTVGVEAGGKHVGTKEDRSVRDAGATDAIEYHTESTVQLIVDLLLFKRRYNTERLISDSCDVSSSQFYLLILCYVCVNASSTTFMANLGPLLSATDGTNESTHDQIVAILLSCAAQTFGRSIAPIVIFWFENHVACVNYHALPKHVSLSQSKSRNRTTLFFTLVIGVIFVVSLLFLKLFHKVSFVAASTCISVGYGMMWCVTSLYPKFFPKHDFSIILAFFQACAAFSTLLFVLLVSVLQLDNEQVFTALLVSSLTTVVVTTLAFFSRLSTEPSVEQMNYYKKMETVNVTACNPLVG